MSSMTSIPRAKLSASIISRRRAILDYRILVIILSKLRVDEFSAIENNIFPPNARTSQPCGSRDACACTHVFCAWALCALVTLNGIVTVIVRMRNLSNNSLVREENMDVSIVFLHFNSTTNVLIKNTAIAVH